MLRVSVYDGGSSGVVKIQKMCCHVLTLVAGSATIQTSKDLPPNPENQEPLALALSWRKVAQGGRLFASYGCVAM